MVEFKNRQARTYNDAAGQPFAIGQAQVEYTAAQNFAGYAGYVQGGYTQTGYSQGYASSPAVQQGFSYAQASYSNFGLQAEGQTGDSNLPLQAEDFGGAVPRFRAAGFGATGHGALSYGVGLPQPAVPQLAFPQQAVQVYPSGFPAQYSPLILPGDYPALPSPPIHPGAAQAGMQPIAPTSLSVPSNHDTIWGYPTAKNPPSNYPLNIPS